MKLLIAESSEFSPAAKELLSSHVETSVEDLDRNGLLARIEDAEVLWVRIRNRIDEQVFAAAPRLRVVVTNTTGLNHIDLAAAERRGIRVLSLRGEVDFLRTIRATAELTLGLILALVRRIPEAVEHVNGGGWNRDQFWSHDLQGKTAAIIGYGRLGRIVARYLRALDVDVIAVDPDPVAAADAEADGVPVHPLYEALPRADLVSLHVNLCDETIGMFGSSEIGAMKPGAWFVNTARGELVDEVALLRALAIGQIRAAALDVLSDETAAGMGHHRLVQYAQAHRNLIITPHIGGNTRESRQSTELFLATKLVALLERI